jgi:hypothetical protein
MIMLFTRMAVFQKIFAFSWLTVLRIKNRRKSIVLKTVAPVVDETKNRMKSESLVECRRARSTKLAMHFVVF